MNILIFGAGAIGMVFGGFLRKSGNHVTLIARERHVQAIQENGLQIDGIWGEHRIENVPCCTSIQNLDAIFDVVLVAVKSYHTEQVAQAVVSCVHDRSCVIALQNGLGNMETIAAQVGKGRAGGARVIFGSTVVGPGHVCVTVYAQPVMVGSPYPSVDHGLLQELCMRIAQSGIPCEYTDSIEAYVWSKALYNCALNPLGALLQTEYGKLAEHPDTRRCMDAILDECFEVAAAKQVRMLWSHGDEYKSLFYSELVPSTYQHRSSMLQDLEKKRPTEIDYMNGMICRYGRALSIDCPVNRFVTDMVHFLESQGGSS